jgi:hypothetical protein
LKRQAAKSVMVHSGPGLPEDLAFSWRPGVSLARLRYRVPSEPVPNAMALSLALRTLALGTGAVRRCRRPENRERPSCQT